MRVLIVGGGVGGLACAQRLAKRSDAVDVQLINRTPRHEFPPSFLWVMLGRRRPERVTRSLAALARLGVDVKEAEVEGIDASAGVVATSNGEVSFDRLVLAPGAALASDAIPGLAEGAHGFYTRESAERLRDALAAFGGGRVLIVVAAMPFKCPAAPYESAFLIDELLKERGVTARVDMVTAEPQPLPVAGKEIGAQVAAMLEGRGIGFTPGRKLESVDPEAHQARFGDGSEPYDMLVAIPPHRAPTFVADSTLAGPSGWIPVDRSSLRATDGVHAIGDVTAVELSNGMLLPKAGVFAHGQGEVVADNLVAEAAGREPVGAFDGHGGCFLETGGGRAGFIRGDFYAEPEPRARLRRPSHLWRWSKVLFERRWLSRLPKGP